MFEIFHFYEYCNKLVEELNTQIQTNVTTISNTYADVNYKIIQYMNNNEWQSILIKQKANSYTALFDVLIFLKSSFIPKTTGVLSC